MDYPRTIRLDNEKLRKLISEKEELVLQGREKSMEIDAVQGEMDRINEELKTAEKAVDISEFKQESEELTKQYNEIMEKMNVLNERARAKIKENTPQALRDQYDEANKKKGDLEFERNKIALKANQKRDKIIPLGQKLMRPFLEDHYDDYDTLRLENGEIVATIFNHVDDFKKLFEANRAKNVNLGNKTIAVA